MNIKQIDNITSEPDKILGLVTFNFSWAVVQHWATTMEPFLRAFVLLGQVAVAAVTFLYILKKLRLEGKSRAKRAHKRNHEKSAP